MSIVNSFHATPNLIYWVTMECAFENILFCSMLDRPWEDIYLTNMNFSLCTHCCAPDNFCCSNWTKFFGVYTLEWRFDFFLNYTSSPPCHSWTLPQHKIKSSEISFLIGFNLWNVIFHGNHSSIFNHRGHYDNIFSGYTIFLCGTLYSNHLLTLLHQIY